MAAQGFPPPRPLSRRLLTAGCVAGGHALAIGLALWGPWVGRDVRGGRMPSPLVMMRVEPERPPAPSRQAGKGPSGRVRMVAGAAAAGPYDQPALPEPVPMPGLRAAPPADPETPRPVIQPLPVSPPAPPSEAPDPFAAYAQAIWRKIMANRPAGPPLEGTVVLAFRLDPAGRLAQAHIAQPSGIALLDRQALRALHQAAPFPPLPEGAGPAGHDFTVPIHFHPQTAPMR